MFLCDLSYTTLFAFILEFTISATVIALFIFIAVIVGYVIHNKKRNPNEKLPLSDDVQKMYYDKYEQELKNQDKQ